MVKGAIFDLDGTLIDSMFIWDTFGDDYLKSLGIESKENLAEVFKTFTLEQAAEYYRNHYDIKLASSLSRTRKLLLEKALSGLTNWAIRS